MIDSQLDAISTALAALQAKPSEQKPRRPIGFIQPKEDDEDSFITEELGFLAFWVFGYLGISDSYIM